MDEHAHEIGKVITLNLGALVVSYTAVEAFIRIAAPGLACIYTCLKIYDWIRDQK